MHVSIYEFNNAPHMRIAFNADELEKFTGKARASYGGDMYVAVKGDVRRGGLTLEESDKNRGRILSRTKSAFKGAGIVSFRTHVLGAARQPVDQVELRADVTRGKAVIPVWPVDFWDRELERKAEQVLIVQDGQKPAPVQQASTVAEAPKPTPEQQYLASTGDLLHACVMINEILKKFPSDMRPKLVVKDSTGFLGFTHDVDPEKMRRTVK